MCQTAREGNKLVRMGESTKAHAMAVRTDVEEIKDRVAVLSKMETRVNELCDTVGDYTDLNDRYAF